MATVTLPLCSSLSTVRELLNSRTVCTSGKTTGQDTLISLDDRSSASTTICSKLIPNNISKKAFDWYKSVPLFPFDFTKEYRFVRHSSHLVPTQKEAKITIESLLPSHSSVNPLNPVDERNWYSNVEDLWAKTIFRGRIKLEEHNISRKDLKDYAVIVEEDKTNTQKPLIPTILKNERYIGEDYVFTFCALFITPVECLSSPQSVSFFSCSEFPQVYPSVQEFVRERLALSPSNLTCLSSRCGFQTATQWAQGLNTLNINACDYLGFTLLHEVVMLGQEECFLILLERFPLEIDVNAPDFVGNTPLHWAIRRYKPELKFVERLLEAGADPLLRNAVGDTPLHFALQAAVEEGRRQCKTSCRDNAATGKKFLIQARPTIFKKWMEKMNLSFLLCSHAEETLLSFKKGDELTNNTMPRFAIDKLTTFGCLQKYEVANWIRSLKNNIGVSTGMLFCSAITSFDDIFRYGSLEEIKGVLENVLFEPKELVKHSYLLWNGFSLLHCAAESGNADSLAYLLKSQTSIFGAKSWKYPSKARRTLRGGGTTDVDEKKDNPDFVYCPLDCHQRTPLHIAAARGNVECVKLLAHVCPFALSLVDVYGNTPFLLAAKNSALPTAILVIRHFIYATEYELSHLIPHAKDEQGCTVLMLLCSRGLFSLAQEFIRRFGLRTPLVTPLSEETSEGYLETLSTPTVEAMLAVAASHCAGKPDRSLRKEAPRFFHPLEGPETLFFTAVLAASRFPLVDRSDFLFHCLARLGAVTTLEDMANLLLYLSFQQQLELIQAFIRSPQWWKTEMEDGIPTSESFINTTVYPSLIHTLKAKNVLLCYFCHRNDHFGIRWCVELEMFTVVEPSKWWANDVLLKQHSPLHISISRGDAEAVKFLLEAGADATFHGRWPNEFFPSVEGKGALGNDWFSSFLPLSWALKLPPSFPRDAIINALLSKESCLHAFSEGAAIGTPSEPEFLQQKVAEGESSFGKRVYGSTGLQWSALVEAAVRGQEDVVKSLVSYPHLLPEATLGLQQVIQIAAAELSFRSRVRGVSTNVEIKVRRTKGTKSDKRQVVLKKETALLNRIEVQHRILGYLAPLFDPFFCTLHPFEMLHMAGCVGFFDIARVLLQRICLAMRVSIVEGEIVEHWGKDNSTTKESHADPTMMQETRRHPVVPNVISRDTIEASALLPPYSVSGDKLCASPYSSCISTKDLKKKTLHDKKLRRFEIPTFLTARRTLLISENPYFSHPHMSTPRYHGEAFPYRTVHRDIFSYVAEEGDTELLEELFALRTVGLTPWLKGDLFLGRNAADYALQAGHPSALRMLMCQGIFPLRPNFLIVRSVFSGKQCVNSSALLRGCRRLKANLREVFSDEKLVESHYDCLVCLMVKELLLASQESEEALPRSTVLAYMCDVIREMKKYSTWGRKSRLTPSSTPFFPSWLSAVATLCVRFTHQSIPFLQLLTEEFGNASLWMNNSEALVVALRKVNVDNKLVSFLVSSCECSPFTPLSVEKYEAISTIIGKNEVEYNEVSADAAMSPFYLAALVAKASTVAAMLPASATLRNEVNLSVEKRNDPSGYLKEMWTSSSSSESYRLTFVFQELVGSGKQGEDPFLALISRIERFRSPGWSKKALQFEHEVILILKILARVTGTKGEKNAELLPNSATSSQLVRSAAIKGLVNIVVALLELYGPRVVMNDLDACRRTLNVFGNATNLLKDRLLHFASCHQMVCETLVKIVANTSGVMRVTLLRDLQDFAKTVSWNDKIASSGQMEAKENMDSLSLHTRFCDALSSSPASFLLNECISRKNVQGTAFLLSLGFFGAVTSCFPVKREYETFWRDKRFLKTVFLEVSRALRVNAFHMCEYSVKRNQKGSSPPFRIFLHSVVESGGVHLLPLLMNMTALLQLPIPLLEAPIEDSTKLPLPGKTSLATIDIDSYCNIRNSIPFFRFSFFGLALQQPFTIRNVLLKLLFSTQFLLSSALAFDINSFLQFSFRFFVTTEDICLFIKTAHELDKKVLYTLDGVFGKFSDNEKLQHFGSSVNLRFCNVSVGAPVTKIHKKLDDLSGKKQVCASTRIVLQQGTSLAVAIGVKNDEWTSKIIAYLASTCVPSANSDFVLPRCTLSMASVGVGTVEKREDSSASDDKNCSSPAALPVTTNDFTCSILVLSVAVLCESHSRSLLYRTNTNTASEKNVCALLKSHLCEVNPSELNVIAIALAAIECFQLLELLLQEADYLLRFHKDHPNSGEESRGASVDVLTNEQPQASTNSEAEVTTVSSRTLLFRGITPEEVPLPLKCIVGSRRHVLHAIAVVKNIPPALFLAIALRSHHNEILNLPDANDRNFMYLLFRRFVSFKSIFCRWESDEAMRKEEKYLSRIWDVAEHLAISPTLVFCNRERHNLIHLAAAHGCVSLLQKWMKGSSLSSPPLWSSQVLPQPEATSSFFSTLQNSVVNYPDKKGRTALMLGCRYGHRNVVEELLLFWKANALQCDDQGYSSVMHAALNGHDEIALTLIQHFGASEKEWNAETESEWDALFMNRQTRLIHTIAVGGCWKSCCAVISQAADPLPLLFLKDASGATPLQLAYSFGRLRTLNSLLSVFRSGTLNREDSEKRSLLVNRYASKLDLRIAASDASLKWYGWWSCAMRITQKVIEKRQQSGKGPAQEAVNAMGMREYETHLLTGMDSSLVDITPSLSVCWDLRLASFSRTLKWCVSSQNKCGILALKQYNVIDTCWALHLAALYGFSSIVKLLLALGMSDPSSQGARLEILWKTGTKAHLASLFPKDRPFLHLLRYYPFEVAAMAGHKTCAVFLLEAIPDSALEKLWLDVCECMSTERESVFHRMSNVCGGYILTVLVHRLLNLKAVLKSPTASFLKVNDAGSPGLRISEEEWEKESWMLRAVIHFLLCRNEYFYLSAWEFALGTGGSEAVLRFVDLIKELRQQLFEMGGETPPSNVVSQMYSVKKLLSRACYVLQYFNLVLPPSSIVILFDVLHIAKSDCTFCKSKEYCDSRLTFGDVRCLGINAVRRNEYSAAATEHIFRWEHEQSVLANREKIVATP